MPSRYILSVAQNFTVTVLESINHWDNLRSLRQTLLLFLRNQRPQLIDVDDRSPVLISRQVEVSHTDLSKVTGVVLVKVNPV